MRGGTYVHATRVLTAETGQTARAVTSATSGRATDQVATRARARDGRLTPHNTPTVASGVCSRVAAIGLVAEHVGSRRVGQSLQADCLSAAQRRNGRLPLRQRPGTSVSRLGGQVVRRHHCYQFLPRSLASHWDGPRPLRPDATMSGPHQIRTRCSGSSHRPSPSAVPKTSWNSSRLRTMLARNSGGLCGSMVRYCCSCSWRRLVRQQ